MLACDAYAQHGPLGEGKGAPHLAAMMPGGGQAAAAVTPCTITRTTPLLVSLAYSLGGLVFDSQCLKLYVTETSANQVQVIDLATGTLGAAIPVGSSPMGLDLSTDGKTLYVANSTANSLSVVDVATAKETSRIPVPPGFSNDSPFSVAVSSAGNVFFSTTFAGSGFGGRMMEYEPATTTLRQRTDFWFGGTNTEVTYLAASGDRSTIGIVAGDISSGPVFAYSTATDTFTPEYDTNAFVAFVAVDRTGSTLLVPPFVFGFKNGALTLNGTLSAGGLGVAVDPDGAVGYQVSGANVNVLDLLHLTVTKTIALGDTTNATQGQLAISQDGALLAAMTDHGVTITPTGIVHVVPFASFTAATNLRLASTPARESFALRGHFTLGAASKGLKPVASALQLTVGSVSLNLPAGSLRAVPEGYAFNGQVNGGTLRLLLVTDSVETHAEFHSSDRNAYKLIARGSGFDLSGTSVPVPVALTIGSDAGLAQLAYGEAQVSSVAHHPDEDADSDALDAATAGSAAVVVVPNGRDSFDRHGNLLRPAASPTTGCTYVGGSTGAPPEASISSCTNH
jgi:YVTN family beta-propeller protein